MYTKSNPDSEYARLLGDPDKSKAVQFLGDEASSIIRLKCMIDNCNSDIEYKAMLPLMLELTEHIRSYVFKNLANRYGILEWRKRRYVERLIKDSVS
jgi:hypothetical protein